MALGGAPSLVVFLLLVCLCNCMPPGAGWDQEIDDDQVSAPPNLVSQVPAAAQATVAAGYTNTAEESAEVDTTAVHGIMSKIPVAQEAVSEVPVVQRIMSGPPEVHEVMSEVPHVHAVVSEVPQVVSEIPHVHAVVSEGPQVVSEIPHVHAVVSEGPQVVSEGPQAHAVMSEIMVVHGPVAEVVTTTPGTSSGKEGIIAVGDTRYAWQDWSKWHCNCQEGSMSRVRDITYSAPDVRLDPIQYDMLRFEREVCSYQACKCNRETRECDNLAVTCTKGPMHLCALEDIKQDEAREREQFWHRVYEGLKTLWQVIRDIFPKAAQQKAK